MRAFCYLGRLKLRRSFIFPPIKFGLEISFLNSAWKLISSIKKAECRRIDAFELWCWRRLSSPLDFKEIQPVHPKGYQSWVFIGRTDVEAETPILWSNSSEHQNYLEGLLNHRLLGPSSRVSFRRTGVEPKNLGTDAASLGTTL